jgi:aminoglycoside 6-adenylyltransferase
MLSIARDDLNLVVSWYIGMKNDFKVSSGKMGKYFERYLDEKLWNLYTATFPSGNYEDVWKSLFCACELYRLLAAEIANRFFYSYPYDDDMAMTAYLKHVKNLPDNAGEIY